MKKRGKAGKNSSSSSEEVISQQQNHINNKELLPTPKISVQDQAFEEYKLPLKANNYIFFCFFIINIIAAFLMPISDCDETFNYWEPTHLILYGKGLQTWEYSPVYALRSYLYVWLHVIVGKIALFIGFNSSIEVFYAIRVGLAFLCSLSESIFIKGIYERFGSRIAIWSMLIMLSSSGMFISSVSYLPSTFSMYMLMFAFGTWYSLTSNQLEVLMKYIFVIIFVGCAIIIGWPFCVVCCIPVAIDTIVKYGFLKALKMAVQVSLFLIMITTAVDYHYYKKLFFAPLNLVLYNKGEGSEKFGVEPWNYYFKNLILNFNLTFLFSLITPFVILLHYLLTKLWDKNLLVLGNTSLLTSYLNTTHRWYIHYRWLIYLSPFYIWFIFMTSLPHKEERFMFVVYPVLCLCGGVSIEFILQILDILIYKNNSIKITIESIKEDDAIQNVDIYKMGTVRTRRSIFTNIVMFLIITLIAVIGLSRTLSNVKNFSAPLRVYSNLHQEITILDSTIKTNKTNIPVNVCVGKEWYRFPSSFFLPTSNTFDVRLRFLKSGFSGLLPKYFADKNPTSSIPTRMNDENREEMDRYVKESKCHYIIDFDIEDQAEESYLNKQEDWELVYSYPFLDANKSPNLYRSFFIPYLSDKRNVFGRYVLLTRKKK
ncbi:hypothetical protein ABK040_012776 [Willaertia magna]